MVNILVTLNYLKSLPADKVADKYFLFVSMIACYIKRYNLTLGCVNNCTSDP